MLAARALYTRGAEHVERKDWKKAYVVLIEAWNIKRHWQIAMMLGWAEMELGKTRSAVEHLTMAAADKAPKDKPFPEKIKTLLAEASARLPSVRIQGAPPGARLAIDDVDVGTAPSTEPVAVDPGKHTITATLGAQRVSQEITVSERSPGHEEPVTASLQWPSASGKEAPGSSAKGLGPSIAPIVFGAGAVAGIVTGALLFAQAEAYHTSTDKALVAYRALPPSKWTAGNKKIVGDRLRAEDDLHTGALVSWLGAGVLAATGATLLVVLRRPSTKAPPKTSGGASSSAGAGEGAKRRTAAETPGLEWAPIATPQGAGLLLQGRF